MESKLPVGAQFHEGIAAGWSAGYVSGGFKRRLLCFLPILGRNVEPGQSWLDLGCGSGVLTKELLNRGATVVAVDGSPGMLKQARADVGELQGAVLTWLQSDVQSLSGLSDRAFDGVLCSSVVEYVDRPHALLSEAARVLRPGGRLVISVPPRYSVVRVLQKGIRKVTQIFGRDKFSYLAVSKFEVAPGRVSQWLSDAGFVLDCVTYFDPLLPRALITLFRPALMIVEARKKQSA
jgi:2-polyprenyl-6-hydroxyphenyl methylase/3-demethylubiquinone-9 3-methyltransferase